MSAWTPEELARVHARLESARGERFWRSLEEVADPDGFAERLARELPASGATWLDPVRRRTFLKLMGASLALGGLAGCAEQPREPIVPYVRSPEYVVPGRPLYFATAMPSVDGLGLGLLVESHLGRPTKVEGNPRHPASAGATDTFAQASVLTLYDPDRLQALTFGGAIRTWTDFLASFREALAVQHARRGAGLRLLTEPVTSPTLAAQIAGVLADFPEARWHQWEPAGRDPERAGMQLAFGADARPIYRLADADVILALDADFLGCGPAHLVHARDFARRRRPEGEMTRLYAVESTPSRTGAKADHRLTLRPTEVAGFARALAAAVGVPGATGGDFAAAHGDAGRLLAALTRDLRRRRGRCAVIPGDQQSPEVHALAHLANLALGAVGTTVAYIPPVHARAEDLLASLRTLVDDMAAGRVELLVVVGGNPAFTTPADVPFAQALDRVPLRVHLGAYRSETSDLCHWVIPEAHYLESWADVRAFDGTASVVQPLIAPLYDGRSAHELLATFGKNPERSAYDLVRERWRARAGRDFETAWRAWLEAGVISGTASTPVRFVPHAAPPPSPAARGSSGLELVFRPDPTVHDGRFTRNAWLQELPKPLTHVTWDAAAHVSPATAARLGVRSDDVVTLRLEGRTIEAPVCVLPGHADDTVTLPLGYGGGGAPAGTANAYAIRPAKALWLATGAELAPTGARHALAVTHPHHSMEGRDIVRSYAVDRYPEEAERHAEHGEAPSLYEPWAYPGHRWGMAIDLSACVGCSACVVACQAENNIPVVGRSEVLRGREMHWIRIDTYFTGAPAAPDAYFMPVPCMHCEQAPCEVVCPTEATVHGDEGLNEMVYNRCVGTRYCSNNCPYKVRRFNWFQYSRWDAESLKLLYNPDVTVRSRGVMEKCTYCVQRIVHVRIEAEKAGRPIADGEVRTACQQACPAEAIVFGDLNDPESRVRRLKQEPRSYALLEELNTKPRTTYLAALWNRNPELA